MMKKRMTRMISTMTAAVMLGSLVLTGCGSSQGDGGSDGGSGANEKPTVTLMIDIQGFPPLNEAVKMVKEKFPEYNIISKEWAGNDLNKTIKTTFASGGSESIDIAFVASRSLQNFLDADMLLDLTAYLEEDSEWKSSFEEGALEASTFDGKYMAVPWQAPYPVLIANNELLDQVGIEVRDDMSYDEWMDIGQKLKDEGYATFAIEGASSWFLEQAYLNAFDTEEELNDFCNGKIKFTDQRVKDAFDRVAAVYNNGYCYLGEGALAATTDECLAGFTNGQAAFYVTTNSAVSSALDSSGITDYSIITVPSFSNTGTNYVLGAPDCYFVPSNVKNVEATVEVLKYLTSDEVMQAMVDKGAVVANVNVGSSDPFYSELTKDMSKVHPDEPIKLSDEIYDYITTSALPEYIYSGEVALTTLDGLLENLE